ncbi:hypothetical protein SASPL_130082 [Salvia splendens]|uniref:WRKY domain-containing protein n=1 Tax=Salvia splendens TaxID=180675 RepID=A0A8X8X3K3_SALSN|nr:hypothetical protein SASPL_130082 [Salvia splendens]
MEGGFDDEHDEASAATPPPENTVESPVSGDEEAYAPSPKKRGYYKCSSSKGCPARKQVERSRLDPTTLLITYSCNHNHPLPTTTKNHHHHHKPPLPMMAASSAAKTTISSSSSDTVSPPPVTSFPPAPTSSQPEVEPCPTDDGFVELAGELSWLCDVVPTTTLVVVPTWGGGQADVEFSVPIGEEDKLLFGDLGDLPESSMVFRRHRVEAPCCAGGTG